MILVWHRWLSCHTGRRRRVINLRWLISQKNVDGLLLCFKWKPERWWRGNNLRLYLTPTSEAGQACSRASAESLLCVLHNCNITSWVKETESPNWEETSWALCYVWCPTGALVTPPLFDPLSDPRRCALKGNESRLPASLLNVQPNTHSFIINTPAQLMLWPPHHPHPPANKDLCLRLSRYPTEESKIESFTLLISCSGGRSWLGSIHWSVKIRRFSSSRRFRCRCSERFEPTNVKRMLK